MTCWWCKRPALSDELDEANRSIRQEQARAGQERDRASGLQYDLNCARTELSELKSKLRDQTEADLLKTSLQIIIGVLLGQNQDALAPLRLQQMHQQQLFEACGGLLPQGRTLLGILGGLR